ncbi:VWA domain-containing protein, partial [Streptomyces sp. NPDC054847]
MGKAVLAAALAGGVLFTAGCSGSENLATDSSEGYAPAPDGAPAPLVPDGGKGGPDRDTPGEEKRDIAPPADYLSTFALDVDTASYDYARRLLKEGGAPGRHQVRPEEFINSFRQDYPRPKGDGFTVTVDGARPGGGAGGGEGEIKPCLLYTSDA